MTNASGTNKRLASMPPERQARIRVQITAQHTPQLGAAIAAFAAKRWR